MILFKKEQYLYDRIVLFLNKVDKYCCALHLMTVLALASLRDKIVDRVLNLESSCYIPVICTASQPRGWKYKL